MDKNVEYRAHALECDRKSANAVNGDDKASWLKLADSWIRMVPFDERTAVEQQRNCD